MRILLIPAIALAFFAPTAHADLTGTTTTGFLSFYDHYTGDPNAYLRSTNYFSPTSATIGAGTEFIFLDALGTNPLSAAITADFTGTTLSIYTEWSNFLDHRFVFTDPSFTAITPTSAPTPPGTPPSAATPSPSTSSRSPTSATATASSTPTSTKSTPSPS